MSEIKLNLTDAKQTLNGTIHGSIADACVAALSAEPETISELEAALARFNKPADDSSPFAWFRRGREIDEQPWDAGIVIIDLAARIVASESTYSQPGPEGEVPYHDGVCATEISVLYRLPDDWLFLNSIEDYKYSREKRRHERAAKPPFDARKVLYGRPLFEWIVTAVNSRIPLAAAAMRCEGIQPVAEAISSAAAVSPALISASSGISPAAHSSVCDDLTHKTATNQDKVESSETESSDPDDALRTEISALHVSWLMTPRDDLQGQSPRDVFISRQNFIDYDLHTRSLQWTQQREGPPCLATDSFAYRFAGFGTHEWVVYYDLVRYLFWCAATLRRFSGGDLPPELQAEELEATIARLDEHKTEWLEQSQPDYDGRIPAIIIDNERKRLPNAMLGRDMVIDEDCPVCQMMGAETGFGLEVGFWNLDGCNMDDDFAFTSFRTVAEWEADRRRWKEFTESFNREWEEREQKSTLN